MVSVMISWSGQDKTAWAENFVLEVLEVLRVVGLIHHVNHVHVDCASII